MESDYIPQIGDIVQITKSEVNWVPDMDIDNGKIVRIIGFENGSNGQEAFFDQKLSHSYHYYYVDKHYKLVQKFNKKTKKLKFKVNN